MPSRLLAAAVFFLSLTALSVVVMLGYSQSEHLIVYSIANMHNHSRLETKNIDISDSNNQNIFLPSSFNINEPDVIVFLHIQKTGGSTFERHMVHDLNLQRECVVAKTLTKDNGKNKKRYDCLRPVRDEQWLFSRLTTGKCIYPCVFLPFFKNFVLDFGSRGILVLPGFRLTKGPGQG